MARKFKKGGKKGGSFKRDPVNDSEGWKAITTENEKWENYYKLQNLLSEDDFKIFKKSFQSPLPLTFRITSSRIADEITKIFKEKHLPLLGDMEYEGESIPSPKPISFYPNDLAWQVEISKQAIRKNEKFSSTQRFLVVETEAGNISRQEAVSMIPPIVLDVKPEHKVLDMCAAPGSKTAQLIESLHSIPNPSGFVVANDADYKRAHMLVHQIKRLNSPNMIVTNHKAQNFPRTTIDDKIIKFDRILCDVPCSGDGTMRKNIQIWTKWGIGDGLGLNKLQYQILQRGIDLLADNGRLVYSTCSLNPIENEAVILQALRKNKNIKIVKTELPGLKSTKGLKNWKVVGKDYLEKQRGEDENYGDELFPLNDDEDYNLEDCIRVYPHQQNTGGFFITVIEKINKEETVDDEPLKKKFKKSNDKEKLSNIANDGTEPFFFLDSNHEELSKCWKFYGINPSSSEITDCCFVRNATGEPSRGIYLSTPLTKKYLIENEERLKIIHSGVKIFVSQRTDLECKWRIQHDALPIVVNQLSDARILTSSKSLFEKLLKEAFPKFHELESIDESFSKQIKGLSQGCAFIRIENEEHDILYPIWIGSSCINLMLSKKETFEVLYRKFGVETNIKDPYKQSPLGPGKPIGSTEESKEEPKVETETKEEA